MSRTLKIGDLEVPVPVIQGGMGVGVSLSGLAGAVAGCGGVGIISTAQIGYQERGFDQSPIETNLKALAKHIHQARELAKGGVIGVNIMVATRKYGEYVRAAVKAGADLIISGAGLPTILPSLVEGAGTKIAPIVSSVKAASVICRLWDRKYRRCPDLVVIEGPRAGGHLGFSREELETITEESYEQEIQGIMTKSISAIFPWCPQAESMKEKICGMRWNWAWTECRPLPGLSPLMNAMPAKHISNLIFRLKKRIYGL